MSPLKKTLSVQYRGEHPCFTVQPSLDWEPGQIRELDAPIDNALFVVLPVADAQPSVAPALRPEE